MQKEFMSWRLFSILMLFFTGVIHSQIPSGVTSGFQNQDADKPSIQLYQRIDLKSDTTTLDTTLGLHKFNRFNYLRRDDFELLPFANVGQAYNKLSFQPSNYSALPRFAASARQQSQLGWEKIKYYRVPTPLTELYFKTAFVQGQQLDALFTSNINEGLNISLGYKGVRSLGQYQNILTSTGDFQGTINYVSPNQRYHLKAHLVNQELLNRENGGLVESALTLFTSADPEFDDRGRLDVNFENAQNVLHSARYFIQQEYYFNTDQTRLVLHNLGLQIAHEAQSYIFTQKTAFEGLGPSYKIDNLYNKAEGYASRIKAYSQFTLSSFTLAPHVSIIDFNYRYNRVLDLDQGSIPSQISDNFLLFGAQVETKLKGLELNGEFEQSIGSDQSLGQISLSFNRNWDKGNFRLKFEKNTRPVAVNMLLNQSDYKNYNWFNDFKPVSIQTLYSDIEFPLLGSLKGSFNRIKNYAYFGTLAENIGPRPMQTNETIEYIKLHHDRNFKYGFWTYQTELIYQKATLGEQFMPIPEFLTRQTIYFEDQWFKKAAKIQTGFRLKYFTEFNLPAYDPVLAEFYLQESELIGGFPLVDFFFQTKIKQTRLFLIYEHMNQMFQSENRHFSAPGYPYRDAFLRFGLVWNFFK